MHQPWKGEMVRATVANTQRDIGNLVTLTEVGKEVRLATWERHAPPRRVTASGEQLLLCEVSSAANNFLGFGGLASYDGEAFVVQSPTALEDIDVLDDGFAFLALGLPR